MNVVWFKRDLRTVDHAPLRSAADSGEPVLCLYVFEPEVINSETFDGSHFAFIVECLRELKVELQGLGGDLCVRIGRTVEILDQLHESHGPITTLRSHEETGEMATYGRDRAVAAWCRRSGVNWRETPQFGVVRGPYSRDGWARRWQDQMAEAISSKPARLLAADVVPGEFPTARSLGIDASTKLEVQQGGRTRGCSILGSFLESRGINYRQDMSSPVTGWNGCSRLSPYLAWGTVSIREVFQATKARQLELREDKGRDPRWLKSLSSFQGRLRWHCHFIQKLEDEPELEFRNMCRLYDGMREDDFDQLRFDAWRAGQTGYPMVDACMRCLHQTGWINFRMRAMLVSFASYHLWLDWRPTSRYLARHFLDYEPGIHYSQFQMQSGVTGINSVRIYSPAKQVKDQDPQGVFIRKYVPELAGVPDDYLAEPHEMPHGIQLMSGCVIGVDYPAPIVEHKTAVKAAASRVYARRRGAEAQAEKQRVYDKHGSRRRPRARRKAGAK
jgi:deoxyribodipyrimidine photo-lyase